MKVEQAQNASRIPNGMRGLKSLDVVHTADVELGRIPNGMRGLK